LLSSFCNNMIAQFTRFGTELVKPHLA